MAAQLRDHVAEQRGQVDQPRIGGGVKRPVGAREHLQALGRAHQRAARTRILGLPPLVRHQADRDLQGVADPVVQFGQ